MRENSKIRALFLDFLPLIYKNEKQIMNFVENSPIDQSSELLHDIALIF